VRFFNAWTLQGLWVTVSLAPALAAMTSTKSYDQPVFLWAGLAIWGLGMTLEVVADHQKSVFKSQPENQNQFIQTGLWSVVRHPNYLGEIILWFGVAVAAFPVLEGWQFLTMISPFFITFLLTRISGIPLLEKRGAQKWGHLEAYQEYLKHTPSLIPRLNNLFHSNTLHPES